MHVYHPFLSQLLNNLDTQKTKIDYTKVNNILVLRYLQVRKYILEPTKNKTSKLTKKSLEQGKKNLQELRDTAPTEEERKKYDTILKAIPSALKAREKLITTNLGLVLTTAKAYYCNDRHLLFSFGVQGLIKAADNYKFGKKSQFSTYATLMIRQQISKGVMNTARIIRLPVNSEIDATLFIRIKEHLLAQRRSQEDTSAITDEEMIDEYLRRKTNLSDTPEIREKIQKKLDYITARIDSFVELDSLPLESQALATEELVCKSRSELTDEETNKVKQALVYLPVKYQYALSRLWGVDNLPVSYSQVSQETGLSINSLEYYERVLADLIKSPLFV